MRQHITSQSMQPFVPTSRQRLWANEWPLRVWMFGGPLIAAGMTIRSFGPYRYVFAHPLQGGLAIVAGMLAFAAAWFAALLLGWPLFGPQLYHQGLKNGGPFQVGDLVQVLSGPNAGRIGRVYALWQQETVRVELGSDAEARYADIFSAYQLLRVDNALPQLSAESIGPRSPEKDRERSVSS
jgi:hypothetical protein